MLSKQERAAALVARMFRPKDILTNDPARLHWYECVNNTMLLLDVPDRRVQEFCDTCGVLE